MLRVTLINELPPQYQLFCEVETVEGQIKNVNVCVADVAADMEFHVGTWVKRGDKAGVALGDDGDLDRVR